MNLKEKWLTMPESSKGKPNWICRAGFCRNKKPGGRMIRPPSPGFLRLFYLIIVIKTDFEVVFFALSVAVTVMV